MGWPTSPVDWLFQKDGKPIFALQRKLPAARFLQFGKNGGKN
jgi:hypothetical protein